MKKIDRLLIQGFIPPLVVWFLVAVFIFNMQFLWKYIDDIVGKGLELRVIMELLFYQALAMVPRALVFAVVIASVMNLGNLAEHYELASMKSAGISLVRIMMPLMLIVGILALASFIFANHIIPVTALQFKTRLYDIRKQKPALDLEAGQFNNDFKNMVIYIGGKGSESQYLEDVRIYDHSRRDGSATQTNAREGELYFTEDERYLIINLKNGRRYENMKEGIKKGAYLPYMRMSFDEFRTAFDMAEFDFSETDKNLFKNHHSLLTLRQLFRGIDSLHHRRDKRVEELGNNINNFYYFRRSGVSAQDSSNQPRRQYVPFKSIEIPKVEVGKEIESFAQLIPEGERHLAFQRAEGFARNVKVQAHNINRSLPRFRDEVAAYEHEVHLKFVFAVACIVFLFVGAPMGAIIRKGGFGWPIFISFIFFMAFFVLHLTGERLGKGLIWPVWLGSWLPVLAIFPLAIWLTQQALNDSNAINIAAIQNFFARFRFKKKKK